MCYRMMFCESWAVNDAECEGLVGELPVFTGGTEETHPNTQAGGCKAKARTGHRPFTIIEIRRYTLLLSAFNSTNT